ncbi:MAG: DUF1905 domain-containing protein [Methanolobus sp.]|uniref:DUF1905 domain-containing protein n=1 Tax=Methanolobus sp. TaxID=1874737 RepID=UPI00272F61F9|nr:DUF1905 domain-containing protein [Methanolobus sp.]MDP2216164.1 DUF1905 domain-containing protein [Methanolobus sp.]
MDVYQTRGEAEIFPQKGGWVYVRVPIGITEQLLHMAQRGLIPIRASVGSTSWDTSLLPMGDGTHFIALNAKVRKKEDIEVGNDITVSFQLRE